MCTDLVPVGVLLGDDSLVDAPLGTWYSYFLQSCSASGHVDRSTDWYQCRLSKNKVSTARAALNRFAPCRPFCCVFLVFASHSVDPAR